MSKRGIRRILLAFSVIAISALVRPPAAFADPFTLATAVARADWVPRTRSGPNHADVASSADNSSSTWIRLSQTSADAAFGLQQGMLDFSHGVATGYTPPSPSWDFGLSYSLEAFSTGLPNLELIDKSITLTVANGVTTVNQVLTGILEFTYETPYEIISSFHLQGAGGGPTGTADSIWKDVFTFSGGTPGSTGLAEIEIILAGTFLAETYATTKFSFGAANLGGWTVSHGLADFSQGVSLESIRLPGDVQLHAASGTLYKTVSVPEPATLLLLCLSIGGAAARSSSRTIRRWELLKAMAGPQAYLCFRKDL